MSLINMGSLVDNISERSYTRTSPLRSTIMSVSYSVAQKSKYRITLELDVMEDFDPHQIHWEDVFELEPAESVSAYVEDLQVPENW